ncbi:MAG TPA: YidB family protein [Xanthobacteraceae bacterium]|jgi:uncharacterized protein YidB (DUF937 family)|nr:YidB family protein [Xanthobacteraceae bacterium]
MGLLDVLRGMQNGPRGAPQPQTEETGGGLSPMTMALLGLLAYKALNSGALGSIFGGGSTQAQPERAPSTVPAGTDSSSSGGLGGLLGGLFGGGSAQSGSTSAQGGGLGSMIPGGLGGLLAGAGAGTVLSSGLDSLLRDLQNSGHGDKAQSWVASGENKHIDPNDLAQALGSDTIDKLSQQTGMNRDELLQGLSQHLPHFVDQLTPDGRIPTEQEAQRMM